MKNAKRTVQIVTNKYVIALALFAFLLLFFDDNNLFVQLDRKHQLNELLRKKKYYEERITATNQQLNDLESNPAAVEKFVRENYLMKRDNEDVFIVEPPQPVPDKK